MASKVMYIGGKKASTLTVKLEEGRFIFQPGKAQVVTDSVAQKLEGMAGSLGRAEFMIIPMEVLTPKTVKRVKAQPMQEEDDDEEPQPAPRPKKLKRKLLSR